MPRLKPLSMNDIITNTYNGLDKRLALILYDGGDSIYICSAEIGSALSSSLWQIKKIDIIGDIRFTWADGNDNFDNVATDLATVEALIYS